MKQIIFMSCFLFAALQAMDSTEHVTAEEKEKLNERLHSPIEYYNEIKGAGPCYIKELVAAGADVNLVVPGLGGRSSRTALVCALRSRYDGKKWYYDEKFVKWLLEHGADPNVRVLNFNGGKPSFFFAEIKEAMKCMYIHGADLSLRDRRERSVFDYLREEANRCSWRGVTTEGRWREKRKGAEIQKTIRFLEALCAHRRESDPKVKCVCGKEH